MVSGGLVSFARSRNAVYHLMVRDATGVLHCKFFHSGYLEGRFKARKRIVLHGKVDVDLYRPGRLEMINPEYELVGDESADSTEVGRIVPIYEAIGSLGSRTLRQVIYSALVNLDAAIPDPLPGALLARYGFPPRPQRVSLARAPAADLRGVLLLPTQPGAAPPAGAAADRHRVHRARAAHP